MGNKSANGSRLPVRPSASTGGRSHRINGYIQEQYLDVVDSEGKMHSNISKQSALAMASEAGMDLVEINSASQTRPRSLCKVIDYGKFLFDQKKAQKGRSKPLEQKEIILRPNIDDNDLNVKASKIQEFIDDGHEVKVVCKFKGREAYLGMQRGADLLQKMLDQLKNSKFKHPVTVSPESKCAWMILTSI